MDASPSVDGGTVDSDAAIAVAHSQVQRIVAPQVPAADTETLAADSAAFAFAAYQKLAESARNLVFSPASISIALAMTYAGAQGTTASRRCSSTQSSSPRSRWQPVASVIRRESGHGLSRVLQLASSWSNAQASGFQDTP